jgi:hypothetical protein
MDMIAVATLERQLRHYHTAGDPAMKKSTIVTFFSVLSDHLQVRSPTAAADASAAHARFS